MPSVGLFVEEGFVEAVFCEEFLVCAVFGDASIIQDGDMLASDGH